MSTDNSNNKKVTKYFVNIHTCTNEPIIVPIPDPATITIKDFARHIFDYCARYSVQGFSASDDPSIYDSHKIDICYLNTVINTGGDDNDSLYLSSVANVPFQQFSVNEHPESEELFTIARSATNLYLRNEKTQEIVQKLTQFRNEQFQEVLDGQPQQQEEAAEEVNKKKLTLPSSLSSLDRKFVHCIAEQLELHHQSTGPSSDRKLVVSYRKAVKKATSGRPNIKPIIITQTKKAHSKIPKGMSTVIDQFLYLGSGRDANDIDQLTKNNISHILNCTMEWPAFHALPETITLKRLPLQDISSANISRLFDEVHQFLDEAKKNGGRVLVHCTIGKSRSASLVLSYLMRTEKMNLGQAHSYLIERRSIIKPNDGFMRQLMDLEHQLYNGQYSNESKQSTSLLWEFNEEPLPTEEELQRMRQEKENLQRRVSEKTEELLPVSELERLAQEQASNSEMMGAFIQRVVKAVSGDIKQSGLPERELRNSVSKYAKEWYLKNCPSTEMKQE